MPAERSWLIKAGADRLNEGGKAWVGVLHVPDHPQGDLGCVGNWNEPNRVWIRFRHGRRNDRDAKTFTNQIDYRPLQLGVHPHAGFESTVST